MLPKVHLVIRVMEKLSVSIPSPHCFIHRPISLAKPFFVFEHVMMSWLSGNGHPSSIMFIQAIIEQYTHHQQYIQW